MKIKAWMIGIPFLVGVFVFPQVILLGADALGIARDVHLAAALLMLGTLSGAVISILCFVFYAAERS